MQGIDLSSAIKYNKKKAGSLWKQEQLPWPLSMRLAFGFVVSPDTHSFAWVVATFQQLNGLKPDGMLGPATLAAMNATEPVMPENEGGHDFESEDEPLALPKEKPISNKPARHGVSNCLIIAGQSVPLPDSMIKLGITASNYRDDGEKQFTQYRKRSKASVFVIHESVTMSAAQTNRILDMKREKSAKKGNNNGKGWDYGIHLNLAPDGHISCHADLVYHRLVQANQMNDDSFGVEVVNPYNPAFAGAPFTRVIDGPWWCWKPKNRERKYTLPTPAQMRAIYPLCEFLADSIDGLPLEFPTADLGPRNTRIDRWKDGAKTKAGIVAHRDFASHADGRYLLEHCIAENAKPLHER
jgi:hypothetical protein